MTNHDAMWWLQSCNKEYETDVIDNSVYLVTVFEIVLCELMDSRSINELTFGGPTLLLVDRRNMQ